MAKYGTLLLENSLTSGIQFKENTSIEVQRIISNNVNNNHRFRFIYGDNGEIWTDDIITGYIHLTKNNMPFLVYNRKSVTGQVLLTDIIIYIKDITSKRVLYQKDGYNILKNNPLVKAWIVYKESGKKYLTITKGVDVAERIAQDLNSKAGFEKFQVIGYNVNSLDKQGVKSHNILEKVLEPAIEYAEKFDR